MANLETPRPIPAGGRLDLGRPGLGSPPGSSRPSRSSRRCVVAGRARSQKMAAENTRIDLKGSPAAVSGRAVHPPRRPATGGGERKVAAGESHLSGFLESGHTRNSSSAGSKARGGSLGLWLLSADRCDPDA